MDRPRPSPRHLRVLELYAVGLTREEIGRELILSSETVKTYLAQVRDDLGARNSTHAVTLCIARGFLCVDSLRELTYVPVPFQDLVSS